MAGPLNGHSTEARVTHHQLLAEVNAITTLSRSPASTGTRCWCPKWIETVVETVALRAVPGLVDDINSGRQESIDSTPLGW